MPHANRLIQAFNPRFDRARRAVPLALALLAATFTGPVHAGTFESGDVDTGFGAPVTPGWSRLYTSAGSANEYALAFARRADGNYVVLLSEFDSNLDPSIVLRLVDRDGNEIDGLGADGTVIRDAGFYDLSDLLIDAAGRIVVAGMVEAPGELTNVALVRFHPDGSSDLDFGTDGVFTTPFDDGDATDDRPVELIEQRVGSTTRYVALVQRRNAAMRPLIGLVGVTPAGELDPSFGNRPALPGRTFIDFVEDKWSDPTALVQTEDNLFVAGTVDYSSTDTDLAVRMFNDEGVPYNGNFGTVVISVDIPTQSGHLFDGADAMALDQAGRLVIGGHASSHAIALRMQGNGLDGLSLDTTFVSQGTPARANMFVSNDTSLVPQAIAERPEDGELFLVGAREVAGTTAGFVQRIDPDGLRGSPDDGMRTYLAPTSGGAQSFATQFEDVLIDDARPVLLGRGPDSTNSLADFDGLLTRLATAIRPPEIFADGFE